MWTLPLLYIVYSIHIIFFPFLLFAKCFPVYFLLSHSPLCHEPFCYDIKYTAKLNSFSQFYFFFSPLFLSFHFCILFFPLLFSTGTVFFFPKPGRAFFSTPPPPPSPGGGNVKYRPLDCCYHICLFGAGKRWTTT